MPRKERKTWLRSARRRRAARTSLSPSCRSAGIDERVRGPDRRIEAGTVSRTRSSSAARPRASSISQRSASPEPMWRRTKVSVGSRMARTSGGTGRAPRSGNGSSAPVKDAEGFSSFSTLHVLLVLLGVHEVLQVRCRREADLDQPALLMRVFVDQLRVVDDGLVDLEHLAGHGRVDLGHGLDGFDGADLVSGDEDHLAELLLRELGDAEHAHVILDADPLVLPRIEIFARIHSLALLPLASSGPGLRTEMPLGGPDEAVSLQRGTPSFIPPLPRFFSLSLGAAVERRFDDPGGELAAAHVEGQRRAGSGLVRWHVGQAQSLLEGRAPGAAGDGAHGPALGHNRMPLARDSPPLDLEAHELARRALRLLRHQGVAPQEVPLVELDDPGEPRLPRRGGLVDLVPVEGHGRFQAEGVARAQPRRAGPGLHQAPPESGRVLRIDVQLEAVLAGVAGARDERR